MNCKDCVYYSESDFLKNKGYCILHDGYVKQDDNCEDLKEGD